MTERDFFFSLVPSGGEILFGFFLSSRRRVLSLSMSKTKERVKEMRERATGTTPSLFVPFFSSSSSKERVKESERERNLSLFFLPSRSGFVQRKLLFFLWSNETRKSSLTDIFYTNIIQQLN